MRYMFIVKGSENLVASGPPPAALIEAIERLGEEAATTGKMVSFGGLKPTSFGARMRRSCIAFTGRIGNARPRSG